VITGEERRNNPFYLGVVDNFLNQLYAAISPEIAPIAGLSQQHVFAIRRGAIRGSHASTRDAVSTPRSIFARIQRSADHRIIRGNASRCGPLI